MKKTIIFLFGILVVISCSTSSDDNNNNNNNNNSTPIIDIDGNTYQTVKICDQAWTKTNLNVSHYRNGDAIPQVSDPNIWKNLTTGAWCYYANDLTNGMTYGKLYNWYAVNDSRGLAPEGYHIPNDAEWSNLINCMGGNFDIEGGTMKETGTTHWETPNSYATNISGFTGLPGGLNVDGVFLNIKNNGLWWTSTEENDFTTKAWYYGLLYNDCRVDRYYFNKSIGVSVRCVKD